MTKRILFFALLTAMIVTLIVPIGASADILNNSVNWYSQSYEGEDAFYQGHNVVAFLENGTGRVQFVYLNNTGYDITAKPFIQFDWGGRYYGAQVTIAANEAATLGIEFTVPSSVTAGLVEHGYYISVEYRQNSGRWYTEETTVGETWNAGMGATTYTLSQQPIVPASLRVWRSIDSGVSWEELTTQFSVVNWTGVFTLNAATTVATRFRFNYSWYENLGAGNGVDTVFSVYHHPPNYGQVADGTLKVYLTDQYANTVTEQTTGWTFDAMSGEVRFTAAPTSNQHVLARYEFWDTIGDRYNSSDAGKTFVVYTQAQVDAQKAHVNYDDIENEFWNLPLTGGNALSVAARQALAQSYVEDDKAYDLYVAGDFAGAKTGWDAAIAKVNEATTAEATLTGTVETGLTGLLTGAGGVVDAYGAKLNAEAQNITDTSAAEVSKIKADASRERAYGTFVILLGVFFILVGVAALIMAVAKFLAGRKAPQQT